MTRIRVNGTDLECVESGTGETVVFVHGSASDWRTWAPQMVPVAERYRAIAYSRRYARPLPDIPDGAPDDMAQHVEDLAALVRDVAGGRAHLVGNSWGAYLALLAARRHPERVASLVLAEPPLLPLLLPRGPEPAELARLARERPAAAAALGEFFRGTWGPAVEAFTAGDLERGFETFARGVLGEKGLARASPARLDMASGNLRTLAAQLTRTPFEPFGEEDARAVRAPVLVLTAQESPPFFRHIADRLAEVLPRAERLDVPEASHVMHEDNPAFVNRALLAWLDRVAS